MQAGAYHAPEREGRMVIRHIGGVISVAFFFVSGAAVAADFPAQSQTSYLQCRDYVVAEQRICYRICDSNYPSGKRLWKRCHRSCNFDYGKDAMWCH